MVQGAEVSVRDDERRHPDGTGSRGLSFPLRPAVGDTAVEVGTGMYAGTQSGATIPSRVQEASTISFRALENPHQPAVSGECVEHSPGSIARSVYSDGYPHIQGIDAPFNKMPVDSGLATPSVFSVAADDAASLRGLRSSEFPAALGARAIPGPNESCTRTRHSESHPEAMCADVAEPFSRVDSSTFHNRSDPRGVSPYQWHSWFPWNGAHKGTLRNTESGIRFEKEGCVSASSSSASSSCRRSARSSVTTSQASESSLGGLPVSRSVRHTARGVGDVSSSPYDSSDPPVSVNRPADTKAPLSNAQDSVASERSTALNQRRRRRRRPQKKSYPEHDGDWATLWFHVLQLKRVSETQRSGYFYPTFPSWYTRTERGPEIQEQTTIASAPASREILVTKNGRGVPDAEVLIPCVFTWPHGGHSVFLVGSFNNWSSHEKIRMVRSGHEFTTIKELPRAVHHYKFIVDDQWRFTPTCPTHTDEHGNVNNVLDISQYEFYNFSLPTEHEKAREDTYYQYVPGSNDYTTDAPALPVLLNKSNCVASDLLYRTCVPLHALANHVYVDSHSAQLFGPNIACTASTLRWRRSHKSLLSSAGQRYSTITYVTYNPLFPGHADPLVQLDTANPLRTMLGRERRLSGVVASVVRSSLLPQPVEDHLHSAAFTTGGGAQQLQ